MDIKQQITEWRRIIARTPATARADAFVHAVAGVASLVANGLEKGEAAEVLTDMALAHSLDVTWAETTIRGELERIEHVNGHDNAEHQPSDLGEWDAGDEPGKIPPRQWLLGNQFCREIGRAHV